MQRAPRMFPGDLPQPGWQQVRMGELMGGAGAPARAAAPGRGRQPPRGAEISPGFRLPGVRDTTRVLRRHSVTRCRSMAVDRKARHRSSGLCGRSGRHLGHA
ncbi:unnamed protein product, partial [Staurois parvus]